MRANDELLDCLVIGGGPAGLTAATYLARFHRRIALFDGDRSRARYIPVSHNCPGFPFGVSGTDLLGRMREQAAHFGVEPTPVRIDTLEKEGDGFVATGDGSTWRARTVLLATGIRDRLPQIDDLEQGIADGVVRICAVCDGYEAADSSIAVLGPPKDVVGHACFLRTFSRQVTVVLSETGSVSADDRERAAGFGIEILPPSAHLELARDASSAFRSCVFSWPDRERVFDTVYPVLGADVKGHLASAIGAKRDENGELLVDARMQTSIDGCYAAGDMVSAVNQIAVAVGHASIASIAIHNRLPPNARQETCVVTSSARPEAIP